MAYFLEIQIARITIYPIRDLVKPKRNKWFQTNPNVSNAISLNRKSIVFDFTVK